MQDHEFVSPEDCAESGMTNCRPSWKRKHKYLSWRHRWRTKSPRSAERTIERAVRYKLYEMGYYAGAVILEIGISSPATASIAISGACEAKRPVQYYGIDTDAESIEQGRSFLEQLGLGDRALFYQGKLSEFRCALPVTPTMVILNCRDGVPTSDLDLLTLFLVEGTPVFLANFFQHADQTALEPIGGFEFLGQFGDGAFIRGSNLCHGEPSSLEHDEFCSFRAQFANGHLSNDRTSSMRKFFGLGREPKAGEWPYRPNKVSYPKTLPSGEPWPKISIVTPSFNQGEFIEQTILSVANQRYPNVEHIVIDGGSTDQTKQILEKHASRLALAISEPDDGQSEAINKGFSHATGEIFTWLNSDDMLAEGALHAMAMAFHRSGADMVVGTCQMLEGDEIVSEHLTSCQNGPLEIDELLDLDRNWLAGRFFYQPELMFTRKLWQRAGGFVDQNLYYSMDYDLWVRFARAGARMHVIGRPIAIYRVHEKQKTFSVDDYQPELRKVCAHYQMELGIPDPNLVSIPVHEPRKYRVALVNDVGTKYGAGIAHARLQDAVESAGHESVLIAAKTDEQVKSRESLISEIACADPDLVILGNLHGADLDSAFVNQVSDRWSTCQVLHDLWTVTGRCAYVGSCSKFCSSCDDSCPTADEYPKLDRDKIKTAWRAKREAYTRAKRPILLANSQWTQKIARRSSIIRAGASIDTIKYGFPIDVFKPRDRELCREILGLPQDRFLVLFAACDVAERRKGVHHLFEALTRLQLPNVTPVCFGYIPKDAFLYPDTIYLGYVEDPRRAALVYSAADVFVGPSQEEAFGQVFVEAAACGTPSVAYNIGGVSEALAHGVSGLLAKSVHPAALADAIYQLYADSELRSNLGAWGRIEVENEWSVRSAYHRLNGVLSESPELLGFAPPRKISFDPSKTGGIGDAAVNNRVGLLERNTGGIEYRSGFDAPEGPSSELGIDGIFRWSTGKSCEIVVTITDARKNRVLLRCLNPLEAQTLTIRSNGKQLAILHPKRTMDYSKPNVLELASGLDMGEHRLVIDCSKSFREDSGSRELSMLFLDVSIESMQSPKQIADAA